MLKSKHTIDKQSETANIVKNITKYLEEELQFPCHRSDNVDYELPTEKASGKHGFIDVLYYAEDSKIALLLEAKRNQHKLTAEDEEQLLEYAKSPKYKNGSYPPFLILTNAKEWWWYELSSVSKAGESEYKKTRERYWHQVIKKTSKHDVPLVSTLELINIFKTIREELYNDFKIKVYNPTENKWSLDNLNKRERSSIDEILKIRETYLGEKPSSELTRKQIEAAIGSIALSYTMKICFYKLLTDYYSDLTSKKSLYRSMSELSSKYGKLFDVEPYDTLEPSRECFDNIEKLLFKFDSVHAISHDDKNNNPIGKLYEALIDEMQIETLGAVFTPDDIVKFMCDLSEKQLKGFRNKKILEPACGSGHFVRELYRRYVDEILKSAPITQKAVANVHIEALKNIRAVDVDAFSCQATMFALLLEQIRDQKTGKTLIETHGRWIVDTAVECKDTLIEDNDDFHPDLIIGNPPYGVKVESEDMRKKYNLVSKDSYGFFIKNSLQRLNENGSLLFIVPNTFLTIKSHFNLRDFIFKNSSIKTVIQLHRNTFPKRDVFPCILNLRKEQNIHNTYKYYDTWPIHPRNNSGLLSKCFENILSNKDKYQASSEQFKMYEISQSLAAQYKTKPIFGGSPSIFKIMLDDKIFIALENIADVKQGLATGDNKKYVFKRADIAGGPLKGGYNDVNKKLVVSDKFLENLSETRRSDLIKNGFDVVDYAKDKYLVPFDKGGEQDTDAGVLNNYWAATQYWIDWSKRSVKQMQKSPKARFQNSQFYFKKGISFSSTGLYAPIFCIKYSGIFDIKGSSIFLKHEHENYFLLGILCSNVVRYISKVFINQTVEMQVGAIQQIPIPTTSQKTKDKISDLVKQIIELKKNSKNTTSLEAKLEKEVYKLYKLDKDDIEEIDTWFKRRYPNFGKNAK